MAGHTPIPWRTDGSSVRGKDNENGNGPWLFDVYGTDDDAAFICRAVNAHEALAAALENFVAHEVEYMLLNHLGDPEKQQRVIAARAALSKAEGRS